MGEPDNGSAATGATMRTTRTARATASVSTERPTTRRMTPEYETLWAAADSRHAATAEIRHMLRAAADALRAAGSPTPRLDAEVLLAHVLGSAAPNCMPGCAIPGRPRRWTPMARCCGGGWPGEPVAYLVGHKDFYGLDLQVDRRVLIPRPETEELVGAVLAALPRDAPGPVADIGTGSGAIAIALAVHRPRPAGHRRGYFARRAGRGRGQRRPL